MNELVKSIHRGTSILFFRINIKSNKRLRNMFKKNDAPHPSVMTIELIS